MIPAAVWHYGRDEFTNIGVNILNAAVLGFIAYGRARLRPIQPRTRPRHAGGPRTAAG
jgi:hypothetical protein